MRLNNKPLGFVINFLLGVVWAFVLIGAATSFLSFYQNSFFFALVSSLVGALPGLAAVLLLEHIITVKENHEELEKQTELLRRILEQKTHTGTDR